MLCSSKRRFQRNANMSDDASGHPYRKMQSILPRLREYRPTRISIVIFAWVAMATTLTTVWSAAHIKADLLAASRPERILVRIPTPVRVPGPERIVERTCPVIPKCRDHVMTIHLGYTTQTACEQSEVGTITIHDDFVVLECHCPNARTQRVFGYSVSD